MVVHEDDFEPPRIAKFKETAERGWYFDGIIYAPELPPKVVDQNGDTFWEHTVGPGSSTYT